MNSIHDLDALIQGEVTVSPDILDGYGRDASIYELEPEAIVYPRDSTEICRIVRYVSAHKALHPSLSLTPRGAGTCMSGGPLSESLILDMTRHFDTIYSVKNAELHVQPGVYLRDIDPVIDKKKLFIGSVPASRALNTIGGMVGNNSGGEQSLRYGNTARSVTKLKAVLADGNEYEFKPLTTAELHIKLESSGYEGELYRRVYSLIEDNYETIRAAKPHTTKNSSGYNLWDVWDPATGIFNMTQLLSGSQGTLGIVTDIHIALHAKPRAQGMLLLYLQDSSVLGDIIETVTRHNPATFEGFDDITFSLGIEHFSQFKSQLGTAVWLREHAALLKSTARFKDHLPNMVLMVEFEANSLQAVHDKVEALRNDLAKYPVSAVESPDEATSASYWQLRRASLALLRQKVHDKYAAPFIDDLTVRPEHIAAFLPRLRKIIRRYRLPATIAGHFGDGNFHIIPLLDIAKHHDRALLEPVLREVIPLVLEYGGTLAGEHNDGMVRGQWLATVFGDEVYELFKETKHIFDPTNIFNPHKKTDATQEFSSSHILSDYGDQLIALKNT